MHPTDEIRGVKSNKLSNKKIILGVTGSIACVECVRLSRELIRHGAEVFPVMTPAATKIICPDAFWFATGNQPIFEISGKTEHVFFCGKVKDPVDLLLISPCTSNTISKIAHGIDDTPVTTFATTAIGSELPVVVVPAMHVSMYDHKIIQENIKKCKKLGISFVGPSVIGKKAKMADIDEIVANVIKKIGRQDLSGKNVLVIGGSTAEKIDDVRIISNLSSGKTAVWLAKNIFYRDGNVELWYGQSQEPVPDYIKTIKFSCIDDLSKLLKNTDISELEIERSGTKVRLRKGGDVILPAAMPRMEYPPAAIVAPAIPEQEKPGAVEHVEETVTGNQTRITSPIVGTFYRSSSPDKPPYVEVGDIVKKGQVLCIIEAMKLMNEIESETTGKIIQALVENGDPVEYGQPLFVIEPA